MKIGVETSTLGNKSTGTNRYLECLLEQLEKSNNEIIKLAPRSINSDRQSIMNSVKKNWYRNFGLSKIARQSVADCYIFPNYFMPTGIHKPSAVVIHDLSFITHPKFYSKRFVAYYNYQIRNTLKQKPIIVTISEHSRQNIKKYLGAEAKDIIVVQAYSRFSTNTSKCVFPDNPEDPYFLYVGHIEPRKNLTFLIEGFLKWKERQKVNYKLKIVGELWIKSLEIMSLMKKYNNAADIEFTGYISEQRLADTYRNASAFVHTSFEEGFGFPVLEAMHYSLPILCTKGIATEEISFPNSVACDPYDDRSFQEGLDKLYTLALRDAKIKYDIKYSPYLMSEQLDYLLNIMELKSNKKINKHLKRAANIEEAVEKTLVYSGLFNAGIRKDKLHTQIFDLEISENELERSLNNLLSNNALIQKNDSFQINDAGHSFYKKEKKSIDKRKLNKILNFLVKIPVISLIAFSGGSANYGAENHDDLDLFIITKPNSVYIVYFIIHFFSVMFHLRKEFCANYLIDETNLRISDSNDFYTAHQIISLTPLKNETLLNQFWKKNEWVKSFFPNFNHNINLTNKRQNYSKQNRFLIPINKTLMLFYKFLYRKKLYNMKKSNSIKLTEHRIKLHTNDHREKIIHEFEKAWTNYLIEKQRKKQAVLSEFNVDDQIPFVSISNRKSQNIRVTA
jgi:glycosyltransferase involved in cell wall biosynthesis